MVTAKLFFSHASLMGKNQLFSCKKSCLIEQLVVLVRGGGARVVVPPAARERAVRPAARRHRAAATAKALTQTGAHWQNTVQAHRRGGRPPPTRRADARARPRRNRRPTGTAPRATGSRTMPANQTRQHDPPIYSPPRAGRARPQSGAQPPSFSSRSATLATGNIPPLSPTVMRRNIVDRA